MLPLHVLGLPGCPPNSGVLLAKALIETSLLFIISNNLKFTEKLQVPYKELCVLNSIKLPN